MLQLAASFDSYKIFYYVGKYLNITRAAASLFLSQSTVSRSIQSLESELGCRLFERSQHGVVFTDEGKVLFEHVSAACESIFSGEERVRHMQLFGDGVVRLGVNDFTFQKFVLPALKDFHRDFPGLRLEVIYLTGGFDAGVADSLSSGNLDFVCTSLFSEPDGGDYDAEKMLSFSDVVIAGHGFDHLRNGGYSLTELLLTCPFVSQSGSDGYLQKLSRSRGIEVNPAFEVNSISLFIPMVREGLCLALIPDMFLSDVKGVFKVPLIDPPPPRNVYIISSSSKPRSSAKDELLKRIRKNCSPQAKE